MSWVLASTRIPSPAWRRPELSTTGLIYMRARYYDPAIGRFISEDSAKDGGNWYAYAGENPVGMVDADGRTAFPVTGLGVVTVIAGAQILAEQVLGYKPGASVDAMLNAVSLAALAYTAGAYTFAAVTALGMSRTLSPTLSAGMALSVSIAVTGVCIAAAMHQVATAMIMDEWDL